MITLFSFIGVPPIIGFFAKQMVLISAIDNGYIFITLIAIITSVISAVYYLVIIKCMFFENIIYNNKNNLNLTLNSIISVTISMLTLLLILYMFYIDVIYYIYL
jgi:NADH-ubiquinone oxidoreductase chain 2